MKSTTLLLCLLGVAAGVAMAAMEEDAAMGRRMGKGMSVFEGQQGFTSKLHAHLEDKYQEKLARLGRKDMRSMVVANPAAAAADVDVDERRRGISFPFDIARPIFLELGDVGCNHAGQPCQLGLSCQDNTCVGPAKAGESCNLDDSGFLCETGSFCVCDNHQHTDCSCLAEKKEGACQYQDECTGGYACNYDFSVDPPAGTCTELGSVEDGGFAIDHLMCEYGLFFDDANVIDPDNSICTSTPADCVVDADCAPSYSTSPGFITENFDDGVFYTCASSGQCVRDGPDCGGAFRAVMALTRKEKANNYGTEKPLDFLSALYKLQKCLYQDYVSDDFKGGFPYSKTGYPSQGAFPFYDGSDWDQKTWVARGGDCSPSDTRCEIGLDCFSGTCYLPNKEGESCAGDNDSCEPGTFCYNATTCWPRLKKDEECHYEYDSLYNYVASTRCMNGYGCNYQTESVTGSRLRRDGVCTEYGTVEAGGDVSDDDFCAYGLRTVPSGDYYECAGISDEQCTNYYDCSYYASAYYLQEDVDYDYRRDEGSTAPSARWQTGFWQTYYYIEGQAWYCTENTTNGRCVFNSAENKCDKLYTKYMTYDKGSDTKPQLPTNDADICALTKCIYEAAIYKGYIPCSGAAGLLPAPVLLLLAVVLAVFLH